MKKLITLVLCALAINSAHSQTNVPNGDFEHWYNVTVSSTLDYWDIGTGPTDSWMGTLNSLATRPGGTPADINALLNKYGSK